MSDITGTNSTDVIVQTGTTSDTINAGKGDDIVDAGAGSDTVLGGTGSDTLFGGAGNDTLLGGDGKDVVYGGSGNDTIGGGNVVPGATGQDSDNGGDTLYGDGREGYRTAALAASMGNDVISGGNGADTIYGDNGNNLTGTGSGGNDVLSGGRGNDTIYGEGGNDSIDGGQGNDVIVGGAGADVLTGGSGADRFVFNADASGSNSNATNLDRITDFSNEDKIDLVSMLGTTDLNWARAGLDGNAIATANGIWFSQQGSNTMLYADTDGNAATAELQVQLDGRVNLSLNDFLGVHGNAAVVVGDSAQVAEDSSAPSTGNVLANDLVDYGQTLHVTNAGTYQLAHGTLVLNANGTYSYTLNNNAPGVQSLAAGQSLTDSFVYRASTRGAGDDDHDDDGYEGRDGDDHDDDDNHDGDDHDGDDHHSLSARLTITITGTNDAPQITGGVVLGDVAEDGSTVATGSLSFTDQDVTDSHSITGVTAQPGALGTLSASVTTDTAGAGTVSWNYVVDNAALQSLALGETRTETFTVQLSDGTAVVPRDITITLTGANDGPVISGGAQSDEATEDLATQVSGQIVAADVDHGAVLSYSVDADGAGQYGSLTVDANGQWHYTLANDTAAVQSLGANATAIERFTVTVTDEHGASDSREVQVTVRGTNDGPVAVADSASQFNNEIRTLDVLANDTDVDAGDTRTLVSASVAPGQGTVSIVDGQIQFDPGHDFRGLPRDQAATVEISYTIEDAAGAQSTGTLTLSVIGTNTAPVASDVTVDAVEDVSYTAAFAATDGEGDDLTFAITDGPQHGSVTVNADGTYTYLGSDNYNGADSFTYSVTDTSGETTSATVTLNVAAVNDGPVAGAERSLSAAEDDAGFSVDLLVGASDVDDAVLHATNVDVPAAYAGAVTIDGDTIHVDPSAAVFQSLAPQQQAAFTVSYDIQDAAGATSATRQTVTITIEGTNDAPVALAPEYAALLFEGDAGTTTLDLLYEVSDIDNGESVSVSITGDLPAGVTLDGSNLVLDATDPAYDSLAQGEELTQSVSYDLVDQFGGVTHRHASFTVIGTNDAPTVFGRIVVKAFEDDGNVSVDLLTGASDVDHNAVLHAANFSVTGGYDAALTFSGSTLDVDTSSAAFQSLAAGQRATVTVNYDVVDEHGASVSRTATFGMTGINDGPVANNDAATTDEDRSVTIDVLANDSDADAGDSPTILAVGRPAHGSASVFDGRIIYTPGREYNGDDSFTYTVRDASGATSTATVNVTVNAVNDAPIAANDTATTNEDTAVTIDVLANDMDIDSGDSKTIDAVTQGTNGSVSINGGSVAYTPNANYNGADSFTYTMKDAAGATSTATVSVTVNSINDAPVATIAPLTYTGTEQTALSLKGNGLSVTDVDAGNGLLTVTLGVNTGVLNVTAGTSGATVSGSGSGTVTITGTSAQINSLLNSDATSTVSFADLTNDAPGLNLITNGSFESPDYVGTRTDGTTYVHYSIVNSAFGLQGWNQTGGSLVIADNTTNGWMASDGTQFIEIDTGFNGAEFQRIATTPGQQYLLTFDYAPDAAQTSPTADDRLAVSIDGVRRMTLDRDDTTLTTIDWSHESLVFTATGTSTEIRFADDFTGQTFTGPNLDNVRVVAVSPTLTMTVSDTGNSGSGGTLISSDSAAITIAGVNDAPVNTVPTTTLTVNEDSTGNIISGLGVRDADSADATISVKLSVLHGALTVINGFGFVSVAGNNTGTITMTGTQAAVDVVLKATNNVQYRPVANYNGADTLTMTTIDNGANGTDPGLTGTSTNEQDIDTMAISVTPVNDAPVAVADTNAGDPLVESALTSNFAGDPNAAGNVLANDTDADGNTLTVTAVNGVTGNVGTAVIGKYGTVTINANGTYSYALTNTDPDTEALTAALPGSEVFSYTVSDTTGAASTATLTLTISGVNDRPQSVFDGNTVIEAGFNVAGTVTATGNVLTNDFDVDAGSTIRVSGWDRGALGSSVQGVYGTMTVMANGDYIYTLDNTDPDTQALSAGASQLDIFDFVNIVDEFGAGSRSRLQMTVRGSNDAPTPANDNFSVNEDGSIVVAASQLLANDTDPDTGNTVSIVGLGTGAAHGTVSYNAASTSFTYTPTANYNGNDSFTYVVKDNANVTSTATVNVTVNPVNDAPVAVADTATTNEDTAITINVLANDTDIDSGDSKAIASVGAASHGTVAISGNNVLYTPDANYNGGDTFSYTMTDGGGLTSSSTVNVTVNAVNDAPVAVADTAVTNQNAGVIVDLLANDTDVDTSDTKAIASVGAASHGTVAINGNNVVYTPTAGYSGSDTFSYTMTDGGGLTSSSTVDLTVIATAVNHAPTATADTAVTHQDTAVTIDVLANDTDTDSGDTKSIDSVTAAAHGAVSFSGNRVVYTPTAGYSGNDNFTYTLKDAAGATSTASVDVTVTPNHNPTVGLLQLDFQEASHDFVDQFIGWGGSSEINGIFKLPSGWSTSGGYDGMLNTDANLVAIANPSIYGFGSFADPSAAMLVLSPGYEETVAHSRPGTDLEAKIAGKAGDIITVSFDYFPAGFVIAQPLEIAWSEGGPFSTLGTIVPSTSMNYEEPTHYTFSFTAQYTGPIRVLFSGSALLDNIEILSPTASVQTEIPGQGGYYDIFQFTDADAGDTHTASAVGAIVHIETFVTEPVSGQAGEVEWVAYGAPELADVGFFIDKFEFIVTDNHGASVVKEISVTGIGGGTHTVFDGGMGDDVIYNLDVGTDYFTGRGGSDTFLYDWNVTAQTGAADQITDFTTGTGGDKLDIHGILSGYVPGASTPGDFVKLTAVGNDTMVSVDKDGATGGANFQDFVVLQNVTGVTLTDLLAQQNIILFDPLNHAPTAVADTAVTYQDTAVTIDVLANDSDVDAGDTKAMASVGTPAHGTVWLNGNNVVYTPDAHYFGGDTFSYTMTDAAGATSSNNVSVTVNQVVQNHAPAAVNDTNDNDPVVESGSGVAGDSTAIGNVLANDYDVDAGSILSLVTVNGVSAQFGTPIGTRWGSIVFVANGDYVYTLDQARADLLYPRELDGAVAPPFWFDSINYEVSDPTGARSGATLTINVKGTLDNSVARDDALTTYEDTAIPLAALANNDRLMPDAVPLPPPTVQYSSPHHGTIDYVQRSYIPDANFYGEDTFTYTITDPTGSTSSATVTIDVLPVYDTPHALSFGASVEAGSDINFIDVLANVTDAAFPEMPTALDAGYSVGYAIDSWGLAWTDGVDVYFLASSGFTGQDTIVYGLYGPEGFAGEGRVSVTVLSAGQDFLYGTDQISDTFKFVSTDITAPDVIVNFEAGKGGDKLDIHEMLNGYVPSTSNAADFVKFTASGNNTVVSVDVDGAAGGANFVDIVSLQNSAGVTLTDLLAQQNIIL